MIRTFHHVGAAVLEGGRKVVDLNREVVVLHRIDEAWNVSRYIVDTDPVRGEG